MILEKFILKFCFENDKDEKEIQKKEKLMNCLEMVFS